MSTAQHKRVAKNRISITYDVETNGAKEKIELPFVVGVVGDFSGDKPVDDKPDPEDREFLLTDKENFDAVMARIGPELAMQIPNKLSGDAEESSFEVNLKINSIKDFHPDHIVEQVPILKELIFIRSQLKEVLGKADRSRAFERLLKEILSDQERAEQLGEALSLTTSDSTAEISE